MSNEPSSVHKAIAAVAASVGAVGKNSKMEAGPARYRYRSLDDLMDAVHGPLTEHGVIFAPHNIQMLNEIERTTKSGSVQYHLRALVTYRVYGPAGDFIEAVVFAEGADTGDKAGNKLMSGALKYALGQVLHIPFALDDQDAYVSEPVTAKVINIKDKAAPAKTSNSAMPTREEVDKVIAESAGTLSIGLEQITKKFRTENGGISMEQFFELPVEDVLPFARELAAYAKQAGPRPE